VTFRRVGFTPVPQGPRPGFDHADTYLAQTGSRLYVGHTGADRVDVLDCRSGAYLRALPELPGVAGVLIDSAADLLFTSDRAAAQVSIFRCSDEALLAQVSVGARPNGLAFDPRQRNLWSFNLGDPPGTNCTASVVSVDERRVTAAILLPGRPRWAVFDDSTRTVYANISEPAVIARIDPDVLMLRDTIPVPAPGPHGLAIVPHEYGASLWCAADGNSLVVLDRDSGEVQATLPLPGAPDVVMCDRSLARLFVAVGAPGVVCVFDSVRRIQIEAIETEAGAHTIGWDPATRRLFAFLPQSCGVAIYEDAA
jgi:DNA-binding beta-propeller fold protein YncE